MSVSNLFPPTSLWQPVNFFLFSVFLFCFCFFLNFTFYRMLHKGYHTLCNIFLGCLLLLSITPLIYLSSVPVIHSFLFLSRNQCTDVQYWVYSFKTWWTLELFPDLSNHEHSCHEHSNINFYVDVNFRLSWVNI